MTDLLANIRVLDFTLAAVGPFCTKVLADLGAEVIHVEWPRSSWVALPADQDTRFTREGLKKNRGEQLFLHTNGGKKSLAVNLKDPRGVQIIWDMIPSIDVVVENMTPRVMASLGLSYATLSEINPGLVMCSMTGFGQRGLEGDTGRPCTDPVAQAMSGLNWVTGERDGPPYAIGGGIGDTVTGMTGAAGILAALVGRQTTGKGQHLDLGMVESLAYVDCTTLPAVVMNQSIEHAPFRNGQQNSYTFPMGPFKCTGGYVAIQAPGAGPQSPWGRLCGLAGRNDLVEDPRLRDDASRLGHAREVIDAIEGWLCSLSSRDEALALLATERISAGPLLSHEEMLTHPFFAERGTFGTINYPGIGDVGVVQPPFKYSDAQAFTRGRAPEMGEHSRQLLRDSLCFSDEAIETLVAENVIKG